MSDESACNEVMDPEKIGRKARPRGHAAVLVLSPRDDPRDEPSAVRTHARRPYWKRLPPHCPRKYHKTRKMRTVLMHPPPIFFAPYPAARPRNSLLIS